MTTQTTTNRKATTIKGMNDQIVTLSEALNMPLATAIKNSQAEWASKPSKQAVSTVLEYMAALHAKRTSLITKIKALGGQGSIGQYTRELTMILADLMAEAEEQGRVVSKAPVSKKKESAPKKKAPVSDEEKARRIAVTVAKINEFTGMEIVTIDTPLPELKKIYDRIKAAAPKQQPKEDKGMYTKEQVQEMITKATERTSNTLLEEQERADQLVEQAKSKEDNTVNKDITKEEKALLIKACEDELTKLQEDKKRYATKDDAKFYDAVDKYRGVEERLTLLKGGNVKELIESKYHGLTRTASRKLYNVADITDQYGHAGVDKASDLILSVFTSILGATRAVAHAGVNLTSGTMRATARIIEGNK